MPESELRRRIRDVADTVLVDAIVSFTAIMRERHYTDYPLLVIDELVSALRETSEEALDIAELARAGAPPETFDDEIEKIIDRRRSELRGDSETISE